MNAALVDRCVSRADRLEVFPPVAVRVKEVAEDDRSSLTQLERVVGMDPALAAQVLRVANSPFYGLSREVASLRQAILVLGFRATRDLALALALASSGRAAGPFGRSLWWHAVRSGVAMRELAALSQQAEPQDAFVVGLLHDIGQFVLLATEPRVYGGLLGAVDGEHARLLVAERAAFGVTHPEVGAAALARWQVPERVVSAVATHGDEAPRGAVARLVAEADRWERLLRTGDREGAIRVGTALGARSDAVEVAIDRFNAELSAWGPAAGPSGINHARRDDPG